MDEEIRFKIEQFIKEGREKLQALREAQEEIRLEQARKREAQERKRATEFQTAVCEQLPKAAVPWALFEEGNTDTFEVCTGRVRVIGHVHNDKVCKWTVDVPYGVDRLWDEPGYKVSYRQEKFGPGDLDIALAFAVEAHEQEREFAIERDRRAVEDEKRQEETARIRAEEKAMAKQETAALLTFLEADPVAKALVQALAAVQRERDGYERKLAADDDWIARLEERNAERIAQAERTAEAAQRKADDAAWKAQQAEDRAYEAERKAKRTR